MTIFAVLMPSAQPTLAAKIQAVFGQDSLMVSETQWLISASGTAQEICIRLSMYDPNNPNAPGVGSGIVFATSGYFGRAPTNIWEWIKVKLETPALPPSQFTAPAQPPMAASG